MKWKILIPKSTLKKELGVKKLVNLSDVQEKALIDSLNKAKQSEIGKCGLDKGTVIKAYITTRTGARRIAYLSLGENDTLILLFFRDKDDALGENMAGVNKAFKDALSDAKKKAVTEMAEGQVAVLVIEDEKIIARYEIAESAVEADAKTSKPALPAARGK